MQVASPELDLQVVVDEDAEPVDWDAEMARFLLAFVRNQATSAGSGDGSVDNTSGDERQ